MKFYDENQYFSKYLLFAKVEPDIIPTRAFEAFRAYLDLYWKMLADATPLTDPVAIARVATAQREYDQYSDDRDPAHGLFSSHFGTDWANQFLFEFLFEDAKQLVMPIFEKYKQLLPWGGDFPAEAQPFFSPAFLWTRPTDPDTLETHVFGAFKEYLDAYLKLVEAAEPVTDAQQLSEIQESQLRYLRYRSEKDPARGMFKRFYGEEWTEEYIHGFLFDLERQMAIA